MAPHPDGAARLAEEEAADRLIEAQLGITDHHYDDPGETGMQLSNDTVERYVRQFAAIEARAGNFESAASAYVELADARQDRQNAEHLAAMVDLANGDEEAAWNLPAPPTSITGQPACGSTDPDGNCIERYHQHGCGWLATGEITEALQEHLRGQASQPLVDDDGRTWRDQHGDPLTLGGLIEARSGVRTIGTAGFETGHGPREVTRPQAQLHGIPDATRATASRYAAQMGLAQPPDPRIRAREIQARQQAWQDGHRFGHRPRQPFDGEGPLDRAARLKKPVQLSQVSDTLNGAVGGYTAL